MNFYFYIHKCITHFENTQEKNKFKYQMLKKVLQISLITCKTILYNFKKSKKYLQKIGKITILKCSQFVNIV